MINFYLLISLFSNIVNMLSICKKFYKIIVNIRGKLIFGKFVNKSRKY